MEDLFKDIPANARFKGPLDLPKPLLEFELMQEVTAIANKNNTSLSLMGGGIYPHFIPSAVKHIISRSEFYTAYTPYQAEASQGTLQAIYEYQTFICRLTGMDATNASMYDGGTSVAEAALLACRQTGRKEIVISSAVNPRYREVLKTYAKGAELFVREVDFYMENGTTILPALDDNSACYIIQQPNFFGCIEDVLSLADSIHKNGSLFITVVDPISLGLLKPPGEYGADIVVGEGQSLGISQSFGGPGLGILAVKKELLRQIPGRIVSRTTDLDGKDGFILTLQAREQHIRRERATSNICSNQALCALSACIYLSLVGGKGLKNIGALCLEKSNYLKSKVGSIFKAPTFKEFVAKSDSKLGIDLEQFYPSLKGMRLLSVTEVYSKDLLDKLALEL